MIHEQTQAIFNQLIGVIFEINVGDDYSSISLYVGHSNKRTANLCTKSIYFDDMIKTLKIGDKVKVRYYIVSHKKHDRWYTTANILSIDKDN